MGKKIIIAGLLVLSLVSIDTLRALEVANSVEVRSSAFFHSSKLLRRIYGQASGCYGIEATTKIDCYPDIWADIDFFYKHGHSIGSHIPTRLSIVNVSLGIKFPFCLTHEISAYVGLGPSLARVWIKNEGHSRVTKLAPGGIAKVGVAYTFCSHFFVDLFVDLLYQPVTFHRNLDMGGIKAGIGLGGCF